ncbi:cytochrome P450 family protein [Pseudonocardia sp. CA-107938]|uniref:cytochrome P450 family protein n=1 Tax=Pseudonocardia sp. CA-107938 TaxID=3240021 RepID=UPI003D917E00
MTAPALWSPEFRANPYLGYAQLREAGSVHRIVTPMGTESWLITRYEDARAALADPRFAKDPRYAPQWLRDLGVVGDDTGPTGVNMLNSDPPDHTRLRRVVGKAFTPRRVESLRPRIESITNLLLDAMTGEADLIAEFAFPLPVTVISELLGVPPEDKDSFRAWTTAMITPPLAPEDRQLRNEGVAAIQRYLADLTEQRRAHFDPSLPRDAQPDLLSALLLATDQDDTLTERELQGTLMLLLTAGHETTVNLIGNGMLALLRHRDQLDTLLAQPELLPSAIEELLRYDGPVERGTLRIALEDVEIGGTTIPKGSVVSIALAAADRDPNRFPGADDLDITRRENQHLAFGHGIHFCLGAPLARLEGQIAFGELLRRFPGIQLACPPKELRWRPSAAGIFRGLQALPVKLS